MNNMGERYTARLKLIVHNSRLLEIMTYRMYNFTKKIWLDNQKCKFEIKNAKEHGLTKVYDCQKNDSIICRVYWGEKAEMFLFLYF